ncbi:MAG TPA: Ig-like domain-containing protein [Chitinophagaceae bacterium]|nr:Ig-like domain-containing protein [Chitinophagaceae bacterium]
MINLQRHCLLLILTAAVAAGVKAQVSITSTTTPYTQNFNTLRATSGTSSTLPTGWRLLETGSNANTTYATDAGSSTTGNTYSYGTGTNTERALGCLQSGSLISTLGVQVRNSTGQTITSVTITYTGEQWRCGTAGRTDQLDFQYSLNATSLSSGTWTDNNTLDFASPSTATIGAKDGNAAANRAVKTATITGLNIANNAIFWLRWSDFDASGADDGLAIDDFSLQLNGGDITPPAATAYNPANGATNIALSGNLVITFSENIVKGAAGNITVKRSSDNVTVQTTAVTAASVVVSTNTATIPFSGLAYSTGYYINIDNGSFRDAAGNNYGGISNATTWGFTTAASPPPAVSASPSTLAFGYIPAGSLSAVQSFSYTTANLTAGLTLSAPASFEVSRDGASFAASVNYTLAEAQAGQTVFVRFAPAAANTSYSGTINFSSTGLNSNAVSVSGNSNTPPPATDTLKVVNWNVEWFGGSLGPTDDNLQEQNVKTVMQNINADVYGLGEIVSIARLQNIVSQMPGYSLVVSDFCSNGTTASSCASAQKLAFVYRTSKVTSLRTYAMLKNGSANASYNWSSGRFPYQMEADVTLNGSTKRIQFFMIHAKANTSDYVVSYNRRRDGAKEMHDSLNAQYSAGNWIVMGDYNDDLDRTITTQVAPDTTTSFISFKSDAAFFPVTLPLSLAGLKSTVSYNDVIDHVTIGTEMNQYYVAGSANILRTQVESWIPNYGTTTSDHYPVLSKYVWSGAALRTPEWVSIKQPQTTYSLKAVTVSSRLDIYLTDKQAQPTQLHLLDMNGRVLAQARVQTVNGTVMLSINTGSLSSGIYIVRAQNYSGLLTQQVLIRR